MSIIKKITRVSFILLSFGIPIYSYGACAINYQAVRTGLITLAVDPRVEIGETLATRVFSDVNGSTLVTGCTGSVAYSSVMAGLSASTAVAGAYETGIPGIGVIVNDLWSVARTVPYNVGLSPGQLSPWTNRNSIKMTFVKTGPITSGNNIGSTKIVAYRVNGQPVAEVIFQGARVIQKSCLVDINYKNQTIDLGSPRRNEFTGNGSVALSSERNFSVALVCQSDNIPIDVSFDPVGSSPGTGMIDIQSAQDAAKGVAVEVLDQNRNPINFGAIKTYHSNYEPNIVIPMVARYKQIGSIAPGQANAAMTFTITQN